MFQGRFGRLHAIEDAVLVNIDCKAKHRRIVGEEKRLEEMLDLVASHGNAG
jgi:hypothetical protein